MAWAEWTFRRSRKTSDGATETDHAEAIDRIRKRMGKAAMPAHKRQAPPLFPSRLAYLWRDFVDIIQGAESGGWGPPVVTWSTLRAWCEITGSQLEPWEARLIIRLGALRAEIISEKSASGDQNAN